MQLLELDLKGTRNENRVTGERPTLRSKPGEKTLVFTQRGLFFDRTLTVMQNSVPLQRDYDYWVDGYSHEYTRLTGKPIAGVILLRDGIADVTLSYQALGGNQSLEVESLKHVLDTYYDQYTLTLDAIIDLPAEATPEEHEQDFWTLYHCEPIVAALQRLKVALSKTPNWYTPEELYCAGLLDSVQLSKAQFDLTHIGRTDNPHGLNATSVDLSSLFNWGTAGYAEMLDPQCDDKYATLSLVEAACNVSAYPQLDGHIALRDNPHNDTAASVGAYTNSQFRSLLDGRLPTAGIALDSSLIQKLSYTTLYVASRIKLPAENITQGKFAASQIAIGTPDAEHVLLNNGTWTSLAAIFAAHRPSGTVVVCVGLKSSAQSGVDLLNTTYTNLDAYPIGSLGLIRVLTEERRATGNGGNAVASWKQIMVAQRSSAGWLLI